MFVEAISTAHPLEMKCSGLLITDKSKEKQDKRGGGESWEWEVVRTGTSPGVGIWGLVSGWEEWRG